MKKKSGSSPTAYDVNVFEHETKILTAAGDIEENNHLTLQELRARYSDLNKEYMKLLRKTQKITRIGDSNQRKLLAAYDKIETQNSSWIRQEKRQTGPTRQKAISWQK